MAGFGKRGLDQNAGALRRGEVRKPGDTTGLRNAVPPRIQTGGTLRWSTAIKLDRANCRQIPNIPGVYALVAGIHDEDVVYIAGAKNLQDEFLDEVRTQSELDIPRANAFCYAVANSPYEQADKEIQIFRRRFGKKPRLNSGF
ncbi:MAG: hypothetical protein COW29_07010 [Rhodobacterales bacterium CG15_BIG_FIL_POST_REV_8_21_14_020_59_13]|nr:MAG: hypothetical protein COW29_07010 [Rhodobacterales bacterium CG15_BIG_FIL_POST_REV_8_21_14_020_59_13]